MSVVSQYSKVILLIAFLCYIAGLLAYHFVKIEWITTTIDISGTNFIGFVVAAFFISLLFFGIFSAVVAFLFGYLHLAAINTEITTALYVIPFFISLYAAIVLGIATWSDATGKENLTQILKKIATLFLLSILVAAAIVFGQKYLHNAISEVLASLNIA